MTPLIVNRLVKRFKERTVVNQVSLQVAPGEVVGLLGPNGAGKTTTFRLILGIDPADGGAVFFGRQLDGLPLYRRARLGLGYLPQGASVLRGLTVRENPLSILEALGRPNAAQRTDRLLQRFGLTHLANQKARTLSGGERRRLEFARALCSDPSVLLCDEPFAGVDPLAIEEIISGIRGLKQDGVGVLLTDHNAREALSVCDRVYLLVDGKIVQSGSATEMKASESAKNLYFGATTS